MLRGCAKLAPQGGAGSTDIVIVVAGEHYSSCCIKPGCIFVSNKIFENTKTQGHRKENKSKIEKDRIEKIKNPWFTELHNECQK